MRNYFVELYNAQYVPVTARVVKAESLRDAEKIATGILLDIKAHDFNIIAPGITFRNLGI